MNEGMKIPDENPSGTGSRSRREERALAPVLAPALDPRYCVKVAPPKGRPFTAP
jgi:hypothetical protein